MHSAITLLGTPAQAYAIQHRGHKSAFTVPKNVQIIVVLLLRW